MYIVDLRHIVKKFDISEKSIFALRDFSLKIEPGEYISIVGTSGSGKSSLMNILGCLDPIQSGSYFFDEQDVSNLTDSQLATIRNDGIGFIFQSFNLLPKLTLLENVALPLMYNHNLSQKEKNEWAKYLLNAVGLSDRIEAYPGDISGGQRQRVAIARALVNKPKVILADEPTGNLDTQTGKGIMELFRRFHEKLGTTIIVVTHDQEVAAYADRVVTLFDGYKYADVNLKQLENDMRLTSDYYTVGRVA